MISGIITGILLLSFLGITAWAYSSRQRARFDDAAQLPLRDESDQSSLTRLDPSSLTRLKANSAKQCCCGDGKERCQ